MTRKHFKALAEAIATNKELQGEVMTAEEMRVSIAIDIATICRKDNPRFDIGRFYRACEIER